MKRRSLTLVLCLLATLSLASVGFAAWVISAGDTENITGNIQVESVTDERVIITKVSQNINDFIFGYLEDNEINDPWLVNDGVPVQQLSLVYTFTVENKALDPGEKVTTTNTAIDASFTAFTKDGEGNETSFDLEDAVEAGYIAAVPTAVVAATANDNEFTVTVTFNWGTLFGGQNPNVFYNSNDVNDTLKVNSTTGIPNGSGDKEMTYGDHAEKYMNLMDEFFEGVNFRLTITADQPAQQN